MTGTFAISAAWASGELGHLRFRLGQAQQGPLVRPSPTPGRPTTAPSLEVSPPRVITPGSLPTSPTSPHPCLAPLSFLRPPPSLQQVRLARPPRRAPGPRRGL
jgi:hypothetical protein